MPLTFAHPAAVLPLAGRLPTAALVVGSLSPDLLYFLRMAPSGMQGAGRFGHTVPGLFLFCVPVGLALLWAWDRVLRDPLVALAPDAARERMAAHDRPPAAVLSRAAAVLLGAVTHVVWDAFTHAGTWATAAVPALERPVAGLPLYALVQHASTVLGLAVVALAVRAWWRRAPRRAVGPGLPRRHRVVRAGTIAAAAGAAGVWMGVTRAIRSTVWSDFFASTLIVGVAVAFWLSVAYGLAERHRAGRRA